VSRAGIIKSCVRCGKVRATNHSRSGLHCADCWTAPRHATDTWMENGACNDVANNPDWWWPDTAHDSSIFVAVAICRGCDVRQTCLEYALQHNEREGIWGGLMPAERQHLKAERKRAC
jgi:hypothetical protein